MTRPKPVDDLIRLNRRVGEVCRHLLGCPLCHRGPYDPGDDPSLITLRIVAFRHNAIRFECRECGLRFSVDRDTFARDTFAGVIRDIGRLDNASWRARMGDQIWKRGDKPGPKG